MKDLLYFSDVDGNEVECEQELYFCYDELQVLSLLYSVGMQKGFSDALYSHIQTIIDSVFDSVKGLVYGLHLVSVPDDKFHIFDMLFSSDVCEPADVCRYDRRRAGMTADVLVMNDSKV